MARNRKNHAKLFEIANGQAGIFSAKQAVSAGFDRRNHHYYLREGQWEREHRGIYRLVHFPRDPSQQYVVWSLWSCNREEKPQGVYSHDTALDIYDLTDLNPSDLHMTVPHRFTKHSKIPSVIVLHKNKLNHKDWRDMGSYRVTTPIRTLYDIVTSGHLSEEFILQAIEEGMSRGLYPKSDIARYGLGRKIKRYS